MGKDTNSTYKKYKAENSELRARIEDIENKVNKFDVDITGQKEPDFLFSDEATNREVYEYMKVHPPTAEYIFREYPDNRDFIEQICNPKHPLFLHEVSEAMKSLFTYIEADRSVEELEQQQKRLTANIENLKKKESRLEESVKTKSGALKAEEDEYYALKEKVSEMMDKLFKISHSEGFIHLEKLLESIKPVVEYFEGPEFDHTTWLLAGKPKGIVLRDEKEREKVKSMRLDVRYHANGISAIMGKGPLFPEIVENIGESEELQARQ